jgi:hypothetical protein
MFGDFVVGHSSAKKTSHWSGIDILADEEFPFLAVDIALRMGGAFAKFLVDALSPHGRRFDEM